MAKEKIEAPTTPLESSTPSPTPPSFPGKTFTKWEIFQRAGLRLKELVCEGYMPIHTYNSGCHTRLIPNATSAKSHIDGEHGGGFIIGIRSSEQPWEGWREFDELGLEIHDLRCDSCQNEVELNARSILKHIKPHMNSNRRIVPNDKFRVTLGYGKPELSENQEGF